MTRTWVGLGLGVRGSGLRVWGYGSGLGMGVGVGVRVGVTSIELDLLVVDADCIGREDVEVPLVARVVNAIAGVLLPVRAPAVRPDLLAVRRVLYVIREAWMDTRSGIGDFGLDSIEQLRPWLGPTPGVPSCPEPPGARRGGTRGELGHCEGRLGHVDHAGKPHVSRSPTCMPVSIEKAWTTLNELSPVRVAYTFLRPSEVAR